MDINVLVEFFENPDGSIQARPIIDPASMIPRYNQQGRYLSENDTLRLLSIAIKHVNREDQDWGELMMYLQRFDASKQRT